METASTATDICRQWAGVLYFLTARVEILREDLNVARFFTPYVDGLYREAGRSILQLGWSGLIAPDPGTTRTGLKPSDNPSRLNFASGLTWDTINGTIA